MDGTAADGRIDGSAADDPFGVYVHVPFCSVRCGYCDFNTYTADELGEGATRASFADTAIAEVHRMAEAVGPRPVETVFFGGGTPTQLPAEDLVRILGAVDDTLGLAPGAEVTTEANPDSVDATGLRILREGGFTRISFGVQSAVRHVLATLERTHDPERVPQAVRWAREAGFDQLSIDLIYGTPGESLQDWEHTLDQAVALEPDHVSAYALIVEDGTAFARKVRRGEVTMPDDDETAEKYLLADERLGAAGLGWYELSNWARDESAHCRHNLLYWRSDDWWGIGPGAHSHVAGRRWWNVKHPAAYAGRLAAGRSPELDAEVVDDATQRMEQVMLRSRLREGVPTSLVASRGSALADLERRGLVDVDLDRVVLTLEGRLLADAVVRDLT
ncbi:radical SAM family heme chaperone HemW [Aeromicrobium halocynthiae]|uniref:radical SAM family heme chaperone HemW n=1 Tax=Aeromicrobium halocynthiae TaxID=560557 RepID=UPI0031D00470